MMPEESRPGVPGQLDVSEKLGCHPVTVPPRP